MTDTFLLYHLNNGNPELLTEVSNVPTLSQWDACHYVADRLKLGRLRTVASSTKLKSMGVYFEVDADKRTPIYRYILIFKR